MRRWPAGIAVASMMLALVAGTGVAGAARTGGPRRAWTVAGTRTVDTSTPACDIYHALFDGHEVIDVTVGTAPRLGSLHLDLCITSVAVGLSRHGSSRTSGSVAEPDLINLEMAGTFTIVEPDGRTTSGTATGTEYIQTGAICSNGLDLESSGYVLTQTARHPGGVPRRDFLLQLNWCSSGNAGVADPITGTLGWQKVA